MIPAIQLSVTSVAYTMDTTIGRASHDMASARKHSGTIHATNGCRNVTFNTFSSRSTDSGANHDSRCGGRGYDDIVAGGVDGLMEDDRLVLVDFGMPGCFCVSISS